jgi:hypothetical protein
MSRWIMRLAVGTAAASLAIAPGIASSQPTLAPTGPLAFGAGIGGFGGEITGATPPIISPATPGTDADKKTRLTYPEDLAKGNRLQAKASAYGMRSKQLPDGVTGEVEYTLTATQAATTVPSAKSTGDFWVRHTLDLADQDWSVYLRNVKTAVSCDAPDKVTTSAAADGLYIKSRDKSIKKVDLPEGAAAVTYDGIGLGRPSKLDAAGIREKYVDYATSVTVSRVGKVADIPEVDENIYKNHGVDTAAGWLVTVADYGVDQAGKRGDLLAKSSVIFGGVVCTIPKDFVAKTPAVTPTTTAPTTTAAPTTTTKKPTVPVKIPAGDAAAEAATSSFPLPIALGGGVLALAAAGVLFGRRRAARSGSQD